MNHSLFSNYTTLAAGNDEMLDKNGQIAPHWQNFSDYLTQSGPKGIEQLQMDVQRLLQENGVTYNVHDALGGQRRLWSVDIVPLMIAGEEWRHIEAGVQQRARLFNLILQDLYGPQTLIQKQLLPLELIYMDPSFLRPCHNVTYPDRHQLTLYAVDLARGPNNRMWVVSDRTQVPSGFGYALENRMVMSQVHQTLFGNEAFDGKKISRISGFFRDLQSTLADLAPNQSNSPRVVVMTPGPHSETYFEHAYLSSYLGYTLVQGADLSVYNGTTYLKSLDGLQPVDTILRRLDDDFCDPLELRPESYLGVSGLLESARRNQVAIANPLGTGIVENLGILPFLQNIARHWLDEDLILPMAATWWCGQPKEREYVLDHLDELIIRPVSGQFREPSVIGHQLDTAEKAVLAEKIRSQPHRYVGQQQVSYSTAPSLIEGHLAPRHTVLRAFGVASQDDYIVMPGGLTRSAVGADELIVSNSRGGISKDTWILSDEQQLHVSLWRLQADQVANTETFTGTAKETLSSRAAENLFWVGRYIERADSSARLLRTILDFLVGTYYLDDQREYTSLCQLLCGLTQITMTYPGFVGEESDERLQNPAAELISVMVDPNRIGGLHADLRAMVNAAYAVRDLWAMDSWRLIQDLQNPWERLAQRFMPSDENKLSQSKTDLRESHMQRVLKPELNRLITQLMALVGLHSDSMSYDASWVMLDMGRRIERTNRTIALARSLLVVQHEPVVENFLLEALLKTTDNLIAYRQRYRSHLQVQTVLELLLRDAQNPRTLLWQLNRLEKHLEQLPTKKVAYQLSKEEQILLLTKTQLQLCNIGDLLRSDDGSIVRQPLDGLLSDVSFHLGEFSDILTQNYFTHTQIQQRFGTAQVELWG